MRTKLAMSILVVLLGLSLQAPVNANVKTTGKNKPIASKRKSALVTYVSREGGTGVGWYILKINGRKEWFSYTSQTKYNNMRNSRAYDVGAEWRIVYSIELIFEEKGPHLWSVTFTGRVLK
jgi:hypothetical protein